MPRMRGICSQRTVHDVFKDVGHLLLIEVRAVVLPPAGHPIGQRSERRVQLGRVLDVLDQLLVCGLIKRAHADDVACPALGLHGRFELGDRKGFDALLTLDGVPA